MAALYWYRSSVVFVLRVLINLHIDFFLPCRMTPTPAWWPSYHNHVSTLHAEAHPLAYKHVLSMPLLLMYSAMHVSPAPLVSYTYPACWTVLLLPVHAPTFKQSSCISLNTYCLSNDRCYVLTTSCWPSVPSILTTLPMLLIYAPNLA